MILFCNTYLVSPQVRGVWALGDGEKVFRNDSSHPERNGNFTWNGDKIHLTGLYNEVLAFQVIVEAETGGASGIEICVDMPVEKISGKIIGGNTLKYGPSGTIEIFTEHYLQVSDSTLPNWFYGSAKARPKKMTGWIPDALIPSHAMGGRGGFPVTIPPVGRNDRHFRNCTFQNQGFWIDIHLPRDQKNYPPGMYYGSVNVLEHGRIIREIPLELRLLPFYLPEENRTTVWLYCDSLGPYFKELDRVQLDNMAKSEAHRHRIEMTGGFDVNFSRFSEEKMNEYKKYLDGSAYTPLYGYHGPGQGVGETLFPVGMYGSNVLGETKEEVQKQSDLWVEWFMKNSPDVTFFWYIIDEPGPNLFPWINERAGWIKDNPGPGKSLPVFTTSRYREQLSGAVDIFAANNGVELDKLKGTRENGGDYWFYNGNRPRYGSVILEGAAVDFRVNSWILYKYNLKLWFIWHGTHWQHNGQGPKSRLHQNVFQNPLTFINDYMQFGNGDGILFYPGHMPFYPEEDRGLNELLPSIRLKNIRRGQQDSNIMWMAEQEVGKDEVLKIINRVVPKAMTEVGMKDPVPWSERGDDYDRIRDELLKILLDKAY